MRVREDSLEIVVFVVQLLNCVRLFVTPWTAARQASLSFTVSVSSNSCSLSQWCHPTISFSDIPFSSCFKSFPASGSFPMNWLFALGGQSVGASTSASVLPMNIQGWFPLGLTGLISLLFKELLSLLQHYTWKASILWHSAFFMVQLSHLYITTGKTIVLTNSPILQMGKLRFREKIQSLWNMIRWVLVELRLNPKSLLTSLPFPLCSFRY